MSTKAKSTTLPSQVAESVTPPNIIVFGETGSGKSSVINMLGDDLDDLATASVSSEAAGATFSSESYPKTINGKQYILYDTIGLNEGKRGTTGAQNAINELFQLILKLDKGVNLLVYVMRAPRIKETAENNYDLFYNIICQQQVPIVIVLTNLEDHDDMSQWWVDNRHAFDRVGMRFSGAGCITASRGKYRDDGYVYQEEYDESRIILRDLMTVHCNPTGWKMPPLVWYNSVVKSAYNTLASLFGLEPLVAAKALYSALVKYGGLSVKDAAKAAEQFERGITGRGRQTPT